ncbi:GNAT family N-acetyltransferase [Bacillus zhangzhouensis]|uniref:GNAT family N-acetyltransferase n=1 Tax=Bacillus zhangzhouensis TaxID=1178540 RepID=UPI002813D734|nr:GNAT family N-acetyltransferase [Bacillus zhangzhouensis]MDR0123980.1 GNAT family N-acetyltransferase [Bacillus zhangzhouensis]
MKVVHAIDDQVLSTWLVKYGHQAEHMKGFKQFALVSGAQLRAVLLYDWSKWESGIFDQHIFHVKVVEAESALIFKELMEKFINWMRTEKCDFFFLRLEAADLEKNRIVQRLSHVYYVGGLTRLEAPPARMEMPSTGQDVMISLPAENEYDEAVLLGDQAFVKSRYALDPYLDQSVVQHFYQEWMRNNLLGRADINLVAKMNDEVVGLIQGMTKGDEMALELFAIRPDAQGKGIGKKLFIEMMKVSYDRGHRFISAGTQLHNTTAIQLYEKMGLRTTNAFLYYHVWPKKGER